MPSLGADMESARVVEWLVKPGDAVRDGDIVATIETDKGLIDIEIFEDAVIESLVAPLDEELPVGAVLAILRGGTDAEPAPATPAVQAPAGSPPAPPPVTATPPASPAPPPAATSPTTPRTPGAHVPASPLARHLARERGIDLAAVSGSGPGGAVHAADLATGGAGAAVAPAEARRGGFDAPSMRRAIGAAMSRSKREIPHYYLSQTVCLQAALEALERRNATVGVAERALPAALLLRASALALAARPGFNGHFENDAFVPADTVNVGWAIALRGGGLIAPAIRHAERASLEALMAAMRDLVRRARGGGLRASELSSATVTVTSLGERGAEAVWPVIHPPQVAMIGFGRIAIRPWVVGDRVEPRPLVTLSLAADHRVSDGHAGSLLLDDIAQRLEAPDQLLAAAEDAAAEDS